MSLDFDGLVIFYRALQRYDGSWNLSHGDDPLRGGFFANNVQHLIAIALNHDDICICLGFEFANHEKLSSKISWSWLEALMIGACCLNVPSQHKTNKCAISPRFVQGISRRDDSVLGHVMPIAAVNST